jgi:hypothetical protein
MLMTLPTRATNRACAQKDPLGLIHGRTTRLEETQIEDRVDHEHDGSDSGEVTLCTFASDQDPSQQ